MLLAAYKERPGVTTASDGVKIRSEVSYSEKKPGGVAIYSDGGSGGILALRLLVSSSMTYVIN